MDWGILKAPCTPWKSAISLHRWPECPRAADIIPEKYQAGEEKSCPVWTSRGADGPFRMGPPGVDIGRVAPPESLSRPLVGCLDLTRDLPTVSLGRVPFCGSKTRLNHGFFGSLLWSPVLVCAGHRCWSVLVTTAGRSVTICYQWRGLVYQEVPVLSYLVVAFSWTIVNMRSAYPTFLEYCR